MNYPIAIHKDDHSDYGVSVPDLPGCFSVGETLEEAASMAKEAIQCHVEGLLLDNDPLPKPQTLEKHLSNSDYAGAIWMLVAVDMDKISNRAKRVNITIPETALNRIDTFAKMHGETRSSFLTRAALQAMQ